ncbi:MAG: hypothetical protein MZW92_14210 [Comamonadaceae bacterium]|nr:hypothetical protein [Comamonadaceae bacterium]
MTMPTGPRPRPARLGVDEAQQGGRRRAARLALRPRRQGLLLRLDAGLGERARAEQARVGRPAHGRQGARRQRRRRRSPR